MAYALGVDVGTTFSAAAVLRDGGVELISLATHQVVAPTLLFARGDDLMFGTPAGARGQGEPAGLAREFKRRVGDTVPIVLSGTPYPAARLVALYAKWVVDTVTSQLGEAPVTIAVTHPANWTAFQLNALQQSLEEVGLGAAGLLSEPEAAVIDFATVAHIAPGEVHVVYDLGGGTFDVAVLRKLRDGFEQVGEAAGLERLGGVDFDEALFQHVLGQLPADSVEAARADPNARQALAQFRRACVEAKEALSSDVSVDVPVLLPGVAATVRVTRHEFEGMIRPVIRQSVAVVRDVLTKAKVRDEDVTDVLLVGGSSRIPLVSELIHDELDLPTRVDAHPKLVVARGAARWAGTTAARRARHATAPPPSTQAPPADDRHRRTPLIVAGAVVLALLVGGGVFALTRSDGDGGGAATASSPAPVTTGSAAPVTEPVVPTTAPASTTPPTPSVTPATTVAAVAPTTSSPTTTTSAPPTESTPPPSLPAGAQLVELPRIGIRFAAPADWIKVDPDPDVPLDEAALEALSVQSGVPVDALRQTVGRQPEPYVFKPPTPGGPYPNINVSRALMSGVPAPKDLEATIRDLIGPDASITSGSNPGGSVWVQYSLRPPSAPIQGYAQAFRVRDGAVLITVKTLDTTESLAVGQLIAATFSSP